MTTHQETPLSVGERIKQKREVLEISLSRLAEAAGISKSYLHEIENNPNVMPSAEVLFNIAEVLETSVAVLLGKRRNPAQPDEGVQIPASLAEYAEEAELSEEETHRLACIKYRNRQPKTARDWAFIHEAIKRAIGTGGRN
jgi:transcriptional regulator with XRE-family HTH domain